MNRFTSWLIGSPQASSGWLSHSLWVSSISQSFGLSTFPYFKYIWKIIVENICRFVSIEWQIRNFPMRGMNSTGGGGTKIQFCQNFQKNAWRQIYLLIFTWKVSQSMLSCTSSFRYFSFGNDFYRINRIITFIYVLHIFLLRLIFRLKFELSHG